MRKVSHVWIAIFAGVCILALIPAMGCGYVPLRVSRPTHAPDSFPDAEIIYNAGAKLGFVNADGSGMTEIPFSLPSTDFVSSWSSPLLSADGRMVFVTLTGPLGYPGGIFVVPAGQKPVDCKWYGIIRFAADGDHMLLDTREQIEKYSPADCGTGNPPEKVYSGVSGALSPDEQYVVEVRGGQMGVEEYIIIRRLETGEERDLGNGDFPVWSRDGEWLAYTGADGIYILQNSPEAQAKRLIALESNQPDFVPVYQEDSLNDYYPPIVSWSPDGQWLVYHVYSRDLVAPNAGAWARHYSIFKVNVNTGETTKLLDGGYSPYWRWPVEEPRGNP